MILRVHEDEKTLNKRTKACYLNILGPRINVCKLSMYKANYFLQK